MTILQLLGAWLSSQAGSSFLVTLLVAALYWAGVLLARWHLIARPVLRSLHARISRVRSSLEDQGTHEGGLKSAKSLLDEAHRLIERLNPLDFLFWNRGQEAAGWQLVHEAELQRVALLSHDQVSVRLVTALQELRLNKSEAAIALAGQIDGLRKQQGQHPDERALLEEALRILYKQRDENFASFISWNNKLNWLGMCSLMLIVVLAGALQNSVLFLVGAAGGFLSRLSRELKTRGTSDDYGSGWTTLFLSPVFGALGGWTGVLLVDVLARNKWLLAEVFKDIWTDPYQPLALGVALLMGLTERAFDRLAAAFESRLSAPPEEERKARSRTPPADDTLVK
jgi:hypothetical protein